MGNLGKIIAATGFEKLPILDKMAVSGHTGGGLKTLASIYLRVEVVRILRYLVHALAVCRLKLFLAFTVAICARYLGCDFSAFLASCHV